MLLIQKFLGIINPCIQIFLIETREKKGNSTHQLAK